MTLALAAGYLEARAVSDLFEARATLVRMLQFEAALAVAEGELGLIPARVAATIAAAAAASPDAAELSAVVADTAETSTPVAAMVKLLVRRVAARDVGAAHYVHWGSTSQDVMDSVLMLQARDALDLIGAGLARICARLVDLTERHRDTPMVARTLAQHASPSVLGLKTAGWLDGLLTQHAAIVRIRGTLPLQCGGAVGTLAALGRQGPALRAALAARLGLRAVVPWHTERSTVREIAAVLGMLAAAAGKIGFDLVLMAQTEVGEAGQDASAGTGTSSALPHKRNPVAPLAVCAGARRAPGLVATVLASYEHLHERAAGAWHAESAALCELFGVAGAVVEQLERAASGLVIDTDAMRANLAQTRGLVMAEAVAHALAPALGRPAAQALVAVAAERARAPGANFEQVLHATPEVLAALGADGIARALDPGAWLGSAQACIDEILTRARVIQRHTAGE